MDEGIKKKNFNHKESLLSKDIHTLQSVRINNQRTEYSEQKSVMDTWKKKHDRTFPTLEDVFNARNLDIPRIRVKVKPFVLDVVKKDTI